MAAAAAGLAQSKRESELRFSKGATANCWTAGDSRRAQPGSRRKTITSSGEQSLLQNTRFQGQKLFELRKILERGEFGILFEFLALLEAFLDRLADIEQR